MEPKWSPNGTKMEPKSAKGRPKGGAENQVANKNLSPGKNSDMLEPTGGF